MNPSVVNDKRRSRPIGLHIDRDVEGHGTLRALGATLLVPVLLGLVVLGWTRLDEGYEFLLLTMGVYAVMAVGYQVFVGATGIVSFGHIAFAGIGAYVAGILTVPVLVKALTLPDLPSWLAGTEVGLVVSMIAAAFVCAILAFVTGLVVLRLDGIAAGIATLAILVITNEILRNAETFTRGTQTFFGVPARANVLSVYATLTVAVGAALLFKLSVAGVRARAVRDDPLAAETSGLNVLRARLVPWVVSAAITGAGGALWAQLLTAYSPKTFYISAAVPVIVMTILGGANSVTGAVVGAVTLTFIQEVLRHVESGSVFGVSVPSVHGIAQAAVGVVLILLLIKRPTGLMGGYEPELSGRKETQS